MTFKKSQNPEACNAALERVWLNGGTEIFKLSRARHGFTLIALSSQTKDRRLRFWCPAFFCNSALISLRRTDAEIVFYPVGRDLLPDWPACERLAAGSPPDLFTLVHYFGACSAVDEARKFCDRTGAKLIEDAAHLLGPAARIGSAADFVCYSPRKFLPVPDGGLLVVRDPAHAQRIEKLIAGMRRMAPGALQSQVDRLKRRLNRLLRPHAGQSANVPSPGRVRAMFMSGAAEQALEHIVRGRRIPRIAARRSRFESWAREILHDADRIEEIGKTDGATSLMGLQCEDETAARSALECLREGGIRALHWPPKLPPEACSQANLDHAVHLRSTTILVLRPSRSRRAAKNLPGEPPQPSVQP